MLQWLNNLEFQNAKLLLLLPFCMKAFSNLTRLRLALNIFGTE